MLLRDYMMRCIRSMRWPKLNNHKDVKLRILLPLAFLGLSLLLAQAGESYRTRVIQSAVSRQGRLYEPLPANVAWPRFLDYALNAPAWVGANHMPDLFHGNASFPSDGVIVRDQSDMWYFVFVFVFWYIVVTVVIRWQQRRPSHIPFRFSWRTRAANALLGCYGAFVSYVAIEEKEPPHGYALWFIVVVFLWGAILTSASFYASSLDSVKKWSDTARLVGALYGVAICYGSIKFYQPPYFPSYYWKWFAVSTFIAGCAMNIAVLYVLARNRMSRSV